MYLYEYIYTDSHNEEETCMKKRAFLLILLALVTVFALVACGDEENSTTTTAATTTATTPAPTTTTTTPAPTTTTTTQPLYVGGTTVPSELVLTAPAFARDAAFWYATALGGTVTVDDEFRIIQEGGNTAVSSAASSLRTHIKNVLGSFIPRVEDTSEQGYLSAKEILIGRVQDRAQLTAASVYSAALFAYSSDYVGAFYIGAEDGKIVILASDADAYAAAARFFANNYVVGKTQICVEGDLSSVYIYDKVAYKANNNNMVFLDAEEMNSNASVSTLTVNGASIAAFDPAKTSYSVDLYLSQAYPVVAAEPYTGACSIRVTQASADNGGVATVVVSSKDGSASATYTVNFNRLDYDLTNATLHNLKDGATGVVSLIHDDGSYGTAEIMLELCKKYGLKFSVGFTADRLGTLERNADGTYKVDADGNFSFTLNAPNAGMDGGGTLAKWQALVAENSDYIEIDCHSYTHNSWGLTENKVSAELRGAQQLIQAAFPGQNVLSFVYPGYKSSDRVEEYNYAKSLMPQWFVSGRGLSSGKYNSLTKPDFFYTETCSLYTRPKAEWGKGTASTDGWLMNGIKNAATYGGWVTTMNHMINGKGANEPPADNQTISYEYFEYVCKNYLADYVAEGKIWSAFYTEAAQYIAERNAATLDCRAYADGTIKVTLTDTLDNSMYFFPLTVDVPVSADWTSVTLNHFDAEGNPYTETLSVSYDADGAAYVRLQLVPDLGTATLTNAGN